MIIRVTLFDSRFAVAVIVFLMVQMIVLLSESAGGILQRMPAYACYQAICIWISLRPIQLPTAKYTHLVVGLRFLTVCIVEFICVLHIDFWSHLLSEQASSVAWLIPSAVLALLCLLSASCWLLDRGIRQQSSVESDSSVQTTRGPNLISAPEDLQLADAPHLIPLDEPDDDDRRPF